MAAVTHPITSGEQHRATDATLLAPTAEEPAIVPGTIQPHRQNGNHPANGHTPTPEPFSMVKAWERETQPSTGPFSTPETVSDNRPITTGDIFRWLGLVRPAFGVLLILVGAVGWLGHSLLAGGWINKPVQETQLQAVVTKQDAKDAAILNRIDSIDNVLSLHSTSLGQLMVSSQEQVRVLAHIEGFLAARLPGAIAAAAPLPSDPPIPLRKPKPKPSLKGTGTAWAAKPVTVK